MEAKIRIFISRTMSRDWQFKKTHFSRKVFNETLEERE